MKRGISQRRRESQSGFILLVIFLMAAMIAMMLYQQLPRVAFESERDKEQLLIERGEQYVRAIQLYAQENNKLPASIDDLEKTNNKRYLRKRYKDPYTGKEEWRLIHATGPGGQLTDSLVQKATTTTDANGKSTSSSSSTSTSSTSSTSTSTSTNGLDQPQVNAAVALRPSDVTQPNAQSFNGPLPGSQQNVVDQNGQPQGVPVAPAPSQGFNPAQPQQPPQQGFGLPGQGLPTGVSMPGGVQTNNVGVTYGANGQPVPTINGQQTQGFTPQFPGQQFPGQAAPAGFQPQFPGQQFPGQLPPSGVQQNQQNPTLANGQPVPAGFQLGPNGQLIPAPVGQNPGLPTGGNAGATPGLPGGVGNQGVNLIQQILQTPRAAPTSTTAAGSSGVGTGGIAGVASMHEGPSIAIYKDRQKYQEWEFVYVPQQTAAGAIGGTPGAPGTPGKSGTPNTPGTPGMPGMPGSSNSGLFNPGGNNGGGFPPSGLGNSNGQSGGGSAGSFNPRGTGGNGGLTPNNPGGGQGR